MLLKRFVFLLTTMLIVSLFFQCEKVKQVDHELMIYSGEYGYDREDFERRFRLSVYGKKIQDGSITSADVKEFLNKYYKLNVYMLKKANENDLASSEEFLENVKKREKRQLLFDSRKIFNELEVDTNVTEETLKKVYNSLDRYVKASFIRAYEKKRAKKIVNELKKNKLTMDEAIAKYYPTFQNYKQSIGFASSLEFNDTTWRKMEKAKIGTVIGPEKMKNSYFIFHVDSIKNVDLPDWEKSKNGIKKKYVYTMKVRKTQRIMDSLISHYDIEFNENNMEKVMEKLKEKKYDDNEANSLPLLSISTADSFTLKDVNPMQYPGLVDQDNLKLALIDLVENYTTIQLAKEKKLNLEPEFIEKMERFKKGELARLAFDVFINREINESSITEEGLKEFYESHKDKYANFESMRKIIKNDYLSELRNKKKDNILKEFEVEFNDQLIDQFVQDMLSK